MGLPDRMAKKIRVTPDGCWEWTGCRTRNYGRVQVDGNTLYSHRVIYELVCGPIPDGLQLDHLCRNPPCCNPRHLEAVTSRVNTLRGNGHGKETHCPNGHPYDGDNLYVYVTKAGYSRRECRECRRLAVRRFHGKETTAV